MVQCLQNLGDCLNTMAKKKKVCWEGGSFNGQSHDLFSRGKKCSVAYKLASKNNTVSEDTGDSG